MNAPIRTLLVDDDPDDQEIFSLVVHDIHNNVECYFARDGYAALQLVNSDGAPVPHVIFLDINMPRMNGIECLAELKKIGRLDAVPVYMYSTSADQQIINLCKNLGAVDFIKKPIDPDDLKGDLKAIMSRLK